MSNREDDFSRFSVSLQNFDIHDLFSDLELPPPADNDTSTEEKKKRNITVVSDAERATRNEERIPEGTKWSTNWCVRTWTEWAEERRNANATITSDLYTVVNPDVSSLSKEELAYWLKWFTANPVGHNPLGNTVGRLCQKAGIEGHFTNHSLQATSATRGLEAGVPEKLIMEVTGHRDPRSLQRYQRPSVEPGDLVMADRGFTIEESLALHQARLAIPVFTKGKNQFDPHSVEKTRGIANVRIHVEQVIGLLRQKYTMLQGTLPIDYLLATRSSSCPLVDRVIRVCSALTNLCPSVVPFD
ncbi:hypothetical protein AC249_AIPGENE15541 [Exaiptasia diaphana]|nr:hypothetical protein AC249_AIPGENE15541 [Exaiptasia diaphana]